MCKLCFSLFGLREGERERVILSEIENMERKREAERDKRVSEGERVRKIKKD